jgi:hypothetical protein
MIRRRVLALTAIGVAAGLPLSRLFRPSADAKERRPYDDNDRKAATNIRYIRPAGTGRRSGIDRQNAAALADMDEMIRLVGPGGRIYLLTDAGPYRMTDPIWISHGGMAGEPIKIMGVDSAGSPAKALITGSRTSPYPTIHEGFAAMNPGKDVFRLNDGADHLNFSFLHFENVGNGAILVKGNIADLTLEDLIARNVTRFLERGFESMCTITGLTVRRVSVTGFSKSAFRLDQDTSNVIMENVLGDSMRQDFDNFAEGVDLSGSVHDVVFRRCVMRNSQQTLGSDEFWNGDGFTSEPDTYNIVFEDCIASGNTDAGFDLKSNNVTLHRCKSYGNTANFKLWGRQGVVMEECVSENPVHHGGSQDPRHVTAVWGADILVRNCRFVDQNREAIVYHTDANEKADPPTGSTISVINSNVSTSGELSFVDLNSKVSIDGVDRPFDGRR